MTTNTDTIADALFPRVRQSLLAATFGQPHRSFYTNELVRLADSGIGGVHRELASLSTCGLLTVTAKGNQKHYQANAGAPIFDELCAIVRKTFGVADVLRASLVPLAPRITQAFIYGSVASGQAHAGSDIDVMIVSDSLSLEEVFAALGPIEDALGRHLNPTLYTRREFDKRLAARNAFLTKVMGRPRIALIEGQDGSA